MQNILCNNFTKHLKQQPWSTLLLIKCTQNASKMSKNIFKEEVWSLTMTNKVGIKVKQCETGKNHPSFHKNRIHSGSTGFKIFFFYSLTTFISHFQTLKSCHFSQQKIQNVHLSAELLLADIHFQYKSFLNIQSKCWILCCEFKFLHMGKYVQYQSEYLEKLCVKKLIITFTEYTHTQNQSLHLIFSKCYSQHVYEWMWMVLRKEVLFLLRSRYLSG